MHGIQIKPPHYHPASQIQRQRPPAIEFGSEENSAKIASDQKISGQNDSGHSVVNEMVAVHQKKFDLPYQQQQFLKETLGSFNGKPFTGKDFLQVIQALSQDPNTAKRDKGLLSFALFVSTLTIGIPLLFKGIRQEMKLILKRGASVSELHKIMENVLSPQDKAVNVGDLLLQAHALQFIYRTGEDSGKNGVVYITPEGLKHLEPEAAKPPSSNTPSPTLSRLKQNKP